MTHLRHPARRAVTAAVAALALTVPTAVLTATTASSASGAAVSQAQVSHSPVAKPKKKPAKLKVAVKRSKAYSHYGQAGVKTTAVVTKGKKKAKGKVTFLVNGTKVATRKLKKGKASYTLASTTAPGTYKVTAKYKNKKKATSIRVYNSAITVSTTALTYSQAAIDAYQYTGSALTGTVNFKDAPANKGYVDFYLNGNVKGGSSSPDYCCMDGVDSATGAFDFSHYQFINDLEERGAVPGTTYTYYAFYTDDAGFDDYIYSAPITVTLVP